MCRVAKLAALSERRTPGRPSAKDAPCASEAGRLHGRLRGGRTSFWRLQSAYTVKRHEDLTP